jgi:predicted transposase YbfD/YdcC
MAWSEERNRSRRERRQIHTRTTTPELVCFPHVAQAAQLYRHIGAHKPETVWLLTSREADRFTATQWLQANRQYWGIEGGLHQRLDASTNEDLCRVRNRNAIWVLGMFRRLAVSLFTEWRSRDLKRRHASMTDFHSAMDAEQTRYGLRFVTSRYPTLKERS